MTTRRAVMQRHRSRVGSASATRRSSGSALLACDALMTYALGAVALACALRAEATGKVCPFPWFLAHPLMSCIAKSAPAPSVGDWYETVEEKCVVNERSRLYSLLVTA
jgi:hypothetical protein